MPQNRSRPSRRRLRRRSNNKRKQRTGKGDGIPLLPFANRVARNGSTAWQNAASRTPLFPAKIRVQQMLYYDSTTINIQNTGAVAHHFLSANGIYDPDVTGTGHQPIGFDQIMLFYEQYTVVASRVSINFVATSGSPYRASISLAPDTTSISSSIQHVENGLVKSKAVLLAATQTSDNLHRLDLACNVVSYFGRTSAQSILDDPNLYGTSTSNPTEQVYFDIAGWLPFGLSGATAMAFDFVLSYDVIFWEPRKVASS